MAVDLDDGGPVGRDVVERDPDTDSERPILRFNHRREPWLRIEDVTDEDRLAYDSGLCSAFAPDAAVLRWTRRHAKTVWRMPVAREPMDKDLELLLEAQRIPVAGTAQEVTSLAEELAEKRERQIRALRTLAEIEVELGAPHVGGRNHDPQTGR